MLKTELIDHCILVWDVYTENVEAYEKLYSQNGLALRTNKDNALEIEKQKSCKLLAETALMNCYNTAMHLKDSATAFENALKEDGSPAQGQPAVDVDYKSLFYELSGSIQTAVGITDHLNEDVRKQGRLYR